MVPPHKFRLVIVCSHVFRWGRRIVFDGLKGEAAKCIRRMGLIETTPPPFVIACWVNRTWRFRVDNGMIPVGNSNGVIIAGSSHRLWRVLGAKYIFSSYEFLFQFGGKFWVGKTKMLMEKQRSRLLMEAGLKCSITESAG